MERIVDINSLAINWSLLSVDKRDSVSIKRLCVSCGEGSADGEGASRHTLFNHATVMGLSEAAWFSTAGNRCLTRPPTTLRRTGVSLSLASIDGSTWNDHFKIYTSKIWMIMFKIPRERDDPFHSDREGGHIWFVTRPRRSATRNQVWRPDWRNPASGSDPVPNSTPHAIKTVQYTIWIQ